MRYSLVEGSTVWSDFAPYHSVSSVFSLFQSNFVYVIDSELPRILYDHQILLVQVLNVDLIFSYKFLYLSLTTL